MQDGGNVTAGNINRSSRQHKEDCLGPPAGSLIHHIQDWISTSQRIKHKLYDIFIVREILVYNESTAIV